MSEKQSRQLQNIYSNSCDAASLCQAIAHDLNSNFVLIAWYMKELTWYIPCIYIDSHLHSTGWYLDEKPSFDNIPIEYTSNLKPTHLYQTTNKMILFASETSQIHTSYAFTIKVFLDMLYVLDINQRQLYHKELLLSNICHSIRTPLNGILHMTNMLMNDINNTNSLNQEHLRYLNQSSLSLANNIFDIIDVTQLDIGKLQINKSICNIREIISQVVSIARTMNKATDVKIDHYIDPIVPSFAYTDPKRLKQILINLFDNALKYTQKGEVTLFATASLIFLDHEKCDTIDQKINDPDSHHDQYQVTFSIQDTGIGISNEQQKILFKPPEIIQNSKQYGISLRVSYLLAQKLGGSLYLKHSSKHKGSCFELSLVVYDEEPPEYNSKTLKLLKDKTVLLLDDSNDKITICQVLDQVRMIYHNASSYEEILILHINKDYDLVICNMNIKKENSIEICNKLRKAWHNKKTKYLALTDDPVSIPKNIFDELVTLPVEAYSFKTKLIELFNQTPEISPTTSTKNTYILVVDDERINRIITEKLLRSRGYSHVDLACSGEEAISMIKARPNYYTVVLTDIRMPNMNGFELASHIKKLCSNTQPKILGVTAQMLMDDEPTELFDEFLYKPVDLNELISAIKKIA